MYVLVVIKNALRACWDHYSKRDVVLAKTTNLVKDYFTDPSIILIYFARCSNR